MDSIENGTYEVTKKEEKERKNKTKQKLFIFFVKGK